MSRAVAAAQPRAGLVIAAAALALAAVGCGFGDDNASRNAGKSPSASGTRPAVGTTPGRESAPAGGANSGSARPGAEASVAQLVPDTPAPVPAPLPAALIPRDSAAATQGSTPDVVAQVAVTTAWTFDTRIDKSKWDAELRAAPYLTPKYLKVVQVARPARSPGAVWLEWAGHRAHTVVQLKPAFVGQRPPDTPTTAERTFIVELTAVGEDGWESVPIQSVVAVRLTRASAQAPLRTTVSD